MRLIVFLFFAVLIVVCASQKETVKSNVKSEQSADNIAKTAQDGVSKKIKNTEPRGGSVSNKPQLDEESNAKHIDDPEKNINTEKKKDRSTTTVKPKSITEGNNEKKINNDIPGKNKNTEQKERITTTVKPKLAGFENNAKTTPNDGPGKNQNTEQKERRTNTPEPKSTTEENNQINKVKTKENAALRNPQKKAEEKKFRRILAVLPYQGRSHYMFFKEVMKVLLEEGHHLTTFTSIPMEEDFKNLRQILIKPTIDSWADLFEFDYQTSQTSWEARSDLDKLAESFLFPLYESNEFRQLLNGNHQFDMVLLEPFFMQEPLVFLGKRFNCPVVALATASPESVQDSYLGRPRNPALEAEWTTCAQQPTMNFLQRSANTFSWLLNVLEHKFYYLPKREADMKRVLPYPGLDSLPPLSEMLSEISLTLANTHQLVHEVSPVPPNLIFTPGLHIKENVSLPQDLQKFMDDAKNGVILFTMGSMIPVSKMKKEREIFIETFSKLPQQVLWKSDIDIPNLSSNVKTYKWLPQQAVLAHKNCILFLTHGGMLSKQEAVYNGVPLVSIPLFGDQPMNTGHSQATGLGITIPFKNITVDNLHNAITSVINDNQYSKTLRKNSRIFKEVVARSRSSALYWMNHVMEYEGADYLRKNHELKWFQYYLLDVIVTFLLITVSIISLLMKCAQGLCRLRFPKKPENEKTKNE